MARKTYKDTTIDSAGFDRIAKETLAGLSKVAQMGERGLPNPEEAYDRLGGVIDLLSEWYETEEILDATRLDTVLESLDSIRSLISPTLEASRTAQEKREPSYWNTVQNDAQSIIKDAESRSDSDVIDDIIEDLMHESADSAVTYYGDSLNIITKSDNWLAAEEEGAVEDFTGTLTTAAYYAYLADLRQMVDSFMSTDGGSDNWRDTNYLSDDEDF